MSDVLFGYAAALTPINLIAAVISVAIGITIGASVCVKLRFRMIGVIRSEEQR